MILLAGTIAGIPTVIFLLQKSFSQYSYSVLSSFIVGDLLVPLCSFSYT